MPKAVSTPEIYLLLEIGLDVKQIVNLGYSRQSVYNYQRRYKQAKIRVRVLLCGEPANPTIEELKAMKRGRKA